jgi:hypothetical protein
MRTKATIAVGLAALPFGCYLAISGAPPRVHAATGLGLATAFGLPALFVDRPRDLWNRRWAVLATVLGGILVLDLGMTATISKKEVLNAPVLFLAGVPAMLVLLAVHGLIVQRVR